MIRKQDIERITGVETVVSASAEGESDRDVYVKKCPRCGEKMYRSFMMFVLQGCPICGVTPEEVIVAMDKEEEGWYR